MCLTDCPSRIGRASKQRIDLARRRNYRGASPHRDATTNAIFYGIAMHRAALRYALAREREREREKEKKKCHISAVRNINSRIAYNVAPSRSIVIFFSILILYAIVHTGAKTFLMFAANSLKLVAWCDTCEAFFYFFFRQPISRLRVIAERQRHTSWFNLDLNLRSLRRPRTSFRVSAVNANFPYRPSALNSEAFSYLLALINSSIAPSDASSRP